MSNTILLILLALAVIIILYLLATRTRLRVWHSQKKLEKKTKILTLFQTKKTVTNNDIEKLLGVSDATATRYLSELEKEGKVQQVGTTGRGVEYRIK